MAAGALFVFCASAFFVQATSAQCLGSPTLADGVYGPGPYGSGYGIASTSGGGFAVTSVSPIAPTGITVASENAIEGSLLVAGELPFLGAITLEGALPTAGAGSINYGCGNGNVAIISEGITPAVNPVATGYPAGLGFAGGLGYGPGLGYGSAARGGLGFGAPGFGGVY